VADVATAGCGSLRLVDEDRRSGGTGRAGLGSAAQAWRTGVRRTHSARRLPFADDDPSPDVSYPLPAQRAADYFCSLAYRQRTHRFSTITFPSSMRGWGGLVDRDIVGMAVGDIPLTVLAAEDVRGPGSPLTNACSASVWRARVGVRKSSSSLNAILDPTNQAATQIHCGCSLQLGPNCRRLLGAVVLALDSLIVSRTSRCF
jgi:hypothetical protein